MGEYNRTSAGGTIRFRSDFRQAGTLPTAVRQPMAEELRTLGDNAAQALEYSVDEAYPNLQDWRVSRRLTARALFISLVIGDPNFKWLEYDTDPHWPPFGKCTPLYAWATARGLDPFYVAWKMAPSTPTGSFVNYCSPTRGKTGTIMNMRGGGGKPSQRYSGRLVATAGKYAVSDAVAGLIASLDYWIDDAVERALATYGRNL